ncbi:MAG: glycosyl hydrolase family 15, partial [Symploca sp. SIO2G7]|nr:glycosyl hydrolase family 15 [Symploca sp. SIO2G7]
QATHDAVVEKLQGQYGCKRFLRDGHQSVVEDAERLHYEPGELKDFEHIECEWPLFFCYLLLNSLFCNAGDRAGFYRERLEALAINKNGLELLPELYYVPKAVIQDERENPHSQMREPNDNVPLVWAQSLYYLGQMIQDGLITLGDIDPLARHLKVGQNRRPIVQVALLSEDSDLQQQLANYGIETQVLEQIEPVQVRTAIGLADLYAQIGCNKKLQTTGRPDRRLRSLTTSRIFRIQRETVVFVPAFLDPNQFYITLDYQFLVAQIRSELAYIHEHWNEPGRPTVTLLLTHRMFELGHKSISDSPLLQLIFELKDGECGGVPIKMGSLFQLMLTAATERMENRPLSNMGDTILSYTMPISAYLPLSNDNIRPLNQVQELDLERETDGWRLLKALEGSDNLYEQIELLSNLCRLHSLGYDTGWGAETDQTVTLADLLNEIYTKAGRLELWAIVRRAAGLLDKMAIGLADAATELLVRQKQIAVGKAYSEASLIIDPLAPKDLLAKINEFCGEDIRDRTLTQEILIYLSVLIKSEPELFEGLITLRVSYLILLINSEICREQYCTQDEAYEILMAMSPFDVKMRLRQVLAGYEGLDNNLFRQESIQARKPKSVNWVVFPQAEESTSSEEDWLHKRQREGGLHRVPEDFYPRIWRLLKHCKGIVIGDKLERRNRLVSEIILSDTTPEEKDFALRIEHLFNKIQAPEYRQVNVEALMELSELFDTNSDWQIDDYIVLDVLVGHAVRLAWIDGGDHRAHRYLQDKAKAWRSFYQDSPHRCAQYIAKSMEFLIELNELGGEEMASV